MELQKLFHRAVKEKSNQYRDLKYEPLKITFYPKSPVCSPIFMHLDGLISGLVFSQIAKENKIYWNIIFSYEVLNIPIPIKKYEHSGDWVYRASVMKYNNEPVIKKDTFKKRFNDRFLEMLYGQINIVYTDRGWTKNNDIPIPYEAGFTPFYFYCYGNKTELEKLLQLPLSIGKHREKGFGWIKKIEITNIEKDYSIIGLNAEINRVIPVNMLDIKFNTGVYRTGMFNYKPPYFEIRDTKMCYIPG